MKIALKSYHLKAAMLFAAEKDVRYYLNGVYFNGKTGELVATDGHRLIAIETGWRSDESVIIPRQLIANVLKVIPKSLHDIELEYEPNGKLITMYGLSDFAIDGKYPDYEVCMESDEKKCIQSPARFNVSYMMDASKAMALISGAKALGGVMPPNLAVREPRMEGLSYNQTCEVLNNKSATHFGNDYRITIMPLRTC